MAPRNGLMAITPLFLLIFLFATYGLLTNVTELGMVYLFGAVSLFAFFFVRGVPITERLRSFWRGAIHRDLQMMVWIFILAGIFSSTAKGMGAVDATVNLTLRLLPSDLILAGMFLAACFISLSMGTSVGTIVALVPVATGITEHTSLSLPLIVAAVVGGALFGDNLSFISDTTVVTTRTQGCQMRDKFAVNIRIVLPAALLTFLLYILFGYGQSGVVEVSQVEWLKVIPYLAVLVLALFGINVLLVLCVGCVLTFGVGCWQNCMTMTEWLRLGWNGINGMICLIAISVMAGGLLGLVKRGGGISYLLYLLTRRISSQREAEMTIAGMVCVTNLCTANNTIAILSVGTLAKNIAVRFGVDPRKSASLLDTFSCFIQGIIPYGAQILMAAGLAALSPFDIIPYLFYPYLMGISALLAIRFRYPKKYR